MKRIPAYFYASPNGREPVRDWRKSKVITLEDRHIIGEDIKTVEFGWPLGMPFCRKIAPELYEVRSTLTGGRIARVLFCVHEQQMILLHGFIEKTQKMPTGDINLALSRMKEI